MVIMSEPEAVRFERRVIEAVTLLDDNPQAPENAE
jgi:hypothetical protein